MSDVYPFSSSIFGLTIYAGLTMLISAKVLNDSFEKYLHIIQDFFCCIW